MSIIVIGSVFVDIKGYPSRTYIPGGRNAGKVRYVHGGVSRNIAEDLGNLGLEPVYLSLVDPNGVEHSAVGKCFGRIATAPSGAEGFGYDPLFVPDGYGKSFAELSADEKNAISHRGSSQDG